MRCAAGDVPSETGKKFLGRTEKERRFEYPKEIGIAPTGHDDDWRDRV